MDKSVKSRSSNSETEEEKESVSSNNKDENKRVNSKNVLSISIPQDLKQSTDKDINKKSLISYNQIDLKYITEINQNTLSLNLEKILINQNSFTKLIKNIFQRILKTNSVYQSYQEMHKNFLQTKTKFLDEQFPPNINSLIKGYHPTKTSKKDLDEILLIDYKDISWKRDSELNSNNNNINTSIFPPDNIFINKIIYNKLSNPNLFYALNILGEDPDKIKKLFINNKKDSSCIYGVNLCHNGHFQEVVIDDFFPYNQKLNSKIFLTEEKGFIWPQILEKAYAKLYGSYNLITNKSMENIMKDFTCAPVITIDYFGDNLGNELLEAYKNGWILLGGTGDTPASQNLIPRIPKPDPRIGT